MLRGVLLLLNLTGVPRLVMRLMMDRRVPLRLKLILPAALVYLISPFDVLHDIVPVLGRIDDILVLLISLAMFLGMAPKDIVTEHMRNPRASRSDSGRNSRSDGTVIEGEYHLVDDTEEPAH